MLLQMLLRVVGETQLRLGRQLWDLTVLNLLLRLLVLVDQLEIELCNLPLRHSEDTASAVRYTSVLRRVEGRWGNGSRNLRQILVCHHGPAERR